MKKERQIFTTPSLLAVDDSFDNDKFAKVRIDVLESDVEARGHGFYLTKECLKTYGNTFANTPILAHVVTKNVGKDGNEVLDYGSHDFHIEDDKFKDGETRVIYDEAVVGIVAPDGIEVNENDNGHITVSVLGYIFKDYSNYCLDILESRGGKTSVSAEIGIETEYDEDMKLDAAYSFEAFGTTLLGEDVEPALPNAKAVMLTGEANDRQLQLLSVMQELKEFLDKYTDAVASEQNQRKEEIQSMKFEELLAKYSLKAEDVTFDHENMSDEELEAAFEELAKSGSETESEPEPTANTVELSVKFGDKTKTLSKSLTDVIYALTDLVNATYASEGDYFDCEVFDGNTSKDRYVVMHGWYSGDYYRQSWSQKDGIYALKGEREQLFPQLCTQAELDQLNSLRGNLAALETELSKCKEQLAKHEAEPDKMAVLESDEYSQIVETSEYKELLENHFEITKEDLCAKLDKIVLDKAKEVAKENAKVALAARPADDGVKLFPTGGSTGTGRYGGIFAS